MKIQPNQPSIPQTTQAETPERKERNERIMKVAKGFESIFVNQMIGAMRKTVTKGGLIPESNAERMYQGMMDQEYSQRMAESGQLGLSDLIYQHLLRNESGQ